MSARAPVETAMSAPRSLAMPAEWVPHRATWLAWPHARADWPGKFAAIPWVFAEIVRHLGRAERVELLVQDAKRRDAARRALRRAGVDLRSVTFHRVPTDRSWLRDTGPMFVGDGRGGLVATDWFFNGWARYPNFRRDDRVASRIAGIRGVPVLAPSAGRKRVVLEGGAIDVDGEGTLLATTECLLSRVQARNPGLGRTGFERVVAAALGVRKVVWLGRGIAGDDTHGHVDDLCRFVGPARVVLATEPDPRDPNHRPLAENRERLEGARDARGRRIEVVPLPMPSPLVFGRYRLPASYANFYVANGLVLVPTFNDPADRIALGLLAELFPDRSVVGIHAVDLAWGFGTIHCLTQQEPIAP